MISEGIGWLQLAVLDTCPGSQSTTTVFKRRLTEPLAPIQHEQRSIQRLGHEGLRIICSPNAPCAQRPLGRTLAGTLATLAPHIADVAQLADPASTSKPSSYCSISAGRAFSGGVSAFG